MSELATLPEEEEQVGLNGLCALVVFFRGGKAGIEGGRRMRREGGAASSGMNARWPQEEGGWFD
jgi:hypothetical protein